MTHSTRSILPRPVVHAAFLVAADIGRYTMLAVLILLALPAVVVLLCTLATVATAALLARAAYLAIVPPGREQQTLAALTELYNWVAPAIDTGRGDATLERLEASGIDLGNPTAVVNAVFPLESVPADLDWDAEITAQAAAARADIQHERDREGMSGSLHLIAFPTDHYSPTTLPVVAALPSLPPAAPPAPRKASKPASRKASKSAPKPVPMPTAARSTDADTYVRRSGGRYSKVGGRVKPRKGEQLYRHEPSANSGRGGYIAI